MLRTRVLFTYLVIMVLPLLLLSGFYLWEIQRESAEEHVRLLREYTAQVGRSLDAIVEEMKQLDQLHIARYDILQTLRKDYALYPDDIVRDSRSMADVIGVAVWLNKRIYRLSFVGRYGQIFTQYFPPFLENQDRLFQRIDVLKASGKSIMVFPPIQSAGGEEAYVPLVVELRDPHTWAVIGYACIDIRYSGLEELFSSNTYDPHVNILMINDENIIYDSSISHERAGLEVNPVGEQVLRMLREGDALPALIRVGNGQESDYYALNAVENLETGWQVVVYSASNGNTSPIFPRIGQYVALIAALVALSSLVGGFSFSSFMRQVNILRAFMRSAQDGKIERIEISSNTREVQSLYDSYNSMADTITQSVKREYEARLLQKKTEMDMLLLQINPHFLYNTLSLIRSIAQCSGIEEIDQISMCLSGLLRYSLKSAAYMTLEEELRQVNNYITIQKLRFPDTVFVEFKVDPGLLSCRVIKFILQPLVENSFRHALENKKGDRRLTIDAVDREGMLDISICDNGSGIAPPVLEALQEKLSYLSNHLVHGQQESNEAGGSTRIGLINVHKRLLYAYGSAAGLWVESWLGEGTVVTLRLPVQYADSFQEAHHDQ